MDRSSTPTATSAARVFAHRALAPLARWLIGAGVTPSAVTAFALALSVVGGALLASGRFAAAAPFIILASLGDALDGIVARVGASSSQQGALFDAAADRYQEMAILCGLAFHLHDDLVALALVLAALVASFMVSYGSAKAEAIRVPVPLGSMRRFERALCICVGVTLVPVTAAIARAHPGPPWLAEAPLLLALAIVAVVGNVSAILRLRAIAISTGVEEGASSRSESVPTRVARAP